MSFKNTISLYPNPPDELELLLHYMIPSSHLNAGKRAHAVDAHPILQGSLGTYALQRYSLGENVFELGRWRFHSVAMGKPCERMQGLVATQGAIDNNVVIYQIHMWQHLVWVKCIFWDAEQGFRSH